MPPTPLGYVLNRDLCSYPEPKGTATVQLADYKESSRDFTRTFLSNSHDILLLAATGDLGAAVDASSPEKKPEAPVADANGTQRGDTVPAGVALTLTPIVCETKATGDLNEVRSFLCFILDAAQEIC